MPKVSIAGFVKSILLAKAGFLFGLFTILLATRFFGLSFDFYRYEFQKNQVYQNFSESQQEVEKQALNLIDYLAEKKTALDEKFFSERARSHMIDVKSLFALMTRILLGLSFLLIFNCAFLIFKKQYKELGKQLIWAGIINIGLVSAFFILTAFFWEWAFEAFHRAFFSNDLWLLASDDNLIKMLPEEFFQDIANWILLSVFLLGVVSVIVGAVLLKYNLSLEILGSQNKTRIDLKK